jgi:4,5-DOPA dioxygenase extradiol
MPSSRPTLPSLFVSHGSPMIALHPGAAGAFLGRLGPAIDTAFGRPRAIVAISAHTLARRHLVLAGARHEAIYDFGGFPEALSRLRYDAPGDPALAAEVVQRLQHAGIDDATVLPEGGLDHGIWTPLRYAYPAADVPIVPVAMHPHDPPAKQLAFGAALAPLLDAGVLVLGSGSITHNLRRVFAGRRLDDAGDDVPEVAESAAFRGWMHEHALARDWAALADYRARAPHAAEMHPTDEHLLPFHVAAGAGGRAATPVRLHESVTFGCLGMDAYAFGAGAAALQRALAGEPSPAV